MNNDAIIIDTYIQKNAQNITNNTENDLIEALISDNSNINAIVSYGNLLIENRRFIEAQSLLEKAYNKLPYNTEIAQCYYMTLRRQGLMPECINICLEILKQTDNDYIKSELAVALTLSGNIDDAISLHQKNFSSSERWLEMLPTILLTNKQIKAVNDLFLNNKTLVNKSSHLQQFLLQTLARNNSQSSIKKTIDSFIEYLPNNKPIWAAFELLRYKEVHNELKIYKTKSEISFALNPVPYCPRTTGLSKILYNKETINKASKAFKQPVITKKQLIINIKKFQEVCKELINENTFSQYQHNIEQFKNKFATNKPEFVQILSTGRCGTLALYEFLKKSNQITPFHTMHAQLIPPDRNHLMYRIISGNLDKDVIKTLLIAYLTNRVSEICYAYSKNTTPVIINHWDTIFAPFMGELFPSSKFIHVWRADQKVFESIYSKNQFQNEQLRHCWFDENFTNNQFSCYYDTSLSMPQQIAWYLFFTREYANAYKQTLSNKRMLTIKSEDMFKGNLDTYNILQKQLPINDLSKESFLNAFSKPVNQKKEKIQIKDKQLTKNFIEVTKTIEQLQLHGKFN